MADEKPAAQAGGVPNVLSPARYLAWLYSTPERQPVLAALCEIENEIATSLRPGVDHHVAHSKLQWWQDECARTAQGKAVHPLTRQLVAATAGRVNAADQAGVAGRADAEGRAGVAGRANAAGRADGARASGMEMAALAGVSGFVDTAVWDLASATFETRKELAAYCERWATAMFITAATPAPAWLRLGAAVREIELLSDLARQARTGRLRIPLDELDRIRVDTSSVAQTPWPEPLVALLRERYSALRATLSESVDEIGDVEQSRLRGLFVWAALSWTLSLRAERALPNAIAPRRSHAFSDGWQAWRAARRAASSNFRLR